MQTASHRIARATRRVLGVCVLACTMTGTLAGTTASRAAADSAWAPTVTAVYKLRMIGMELATFHFTSAVKGDSYTLGGYGKLSWGLGLYKYEGRFSGTGTIAGDTVRPATYAYDWKVNSKSGSVRLGFAGGDVQSVAITPPYTPSADAAPLKPEHLKSVFDPLTALIVMSRLRSGDPCDRKIAMFEGKLRFDLILTRNREEKVVEPKPSGQPLIAHVCRVRHVPIAGHKANRETANAIKTEGIEVSLRPIPSANLLVPYKITIPTPFGTAVLTAHQVDITGPGNKPIVLTH